MSAICSAADIQPLAIILILVFVLVMDIYGDIKKGWLYPLIATFMAFIGVGVFSGSDQTVVTQQTYSGGIYYCNGFPAFPLITIMFVLLVVMSVLVMLSIHRSSYGDTER